MYTHELSNTIFILIELSKTIQPHNGVKMLIVKQNKTKSDMNRQQSFRT